MNNASSIEDNFPLIAQTLAQEGFKIVSGIQPAFEGMIREGGYDFEIIIRDINPSFESLPNVYLKEIPDKLTGLLPHVERNHKLCYLDTLGVFLDPFYPQRTTYVILDAIRNTLKKVSDPEQNQTDFAGEFHSYWHADTKCFLTTNEPKAESCIYEHKGLNGKPTKEIVFTSGGEQRYHWCELRNAQYDGFAFNDTAIIEMDENPFIEVEKLWPPQNISDLLNWLKRVHPRVERKALLALLGIAKEYSAPKLIFQTQFGGPFGVSVKFSPSIKTMLGRYRVNKRKGKKSLSPKQMSTIRKILCAPTSSQSFFRLEINDVSERFVYERNLKTPSLKNRHIALIGCGTVGGFAASLLQKAGAGTGNKGQLDLYDDDILKPGNLGRHLLGANYLYESKSDATRDLILQNTSTPVNIQSYSKLSSAQLDIIKEYDLVIDLTGNECFSNLLANKLVELRLGRKTAPKLLYAWIDANGYASRALLDDGSGACYRCLKIPDESRESGALKERYPLFSSHKVEEELSVIAHRCGESYIPFSAGISNAAAGMVQQVALDSFSDNPGFRFRHESHSKKINKTQDSNPTRIKSCPCCSRLQI